MHTCSSCGTQVPREYDEYSSPDVIQPTAGLHLQIHTGCGMFNDIMDPYVNDIVMSIVLCHDCSINFIDTLNEDIKYYFRGGHPNTMCSDNYKEMGCNYSWNSDT